MPKLMKEIKSAVRVPGQGSFSKGREDDLEKLLTPEQGKRLIEKGSLEGDWNFGGTVKAQADKPAADKPAADKPAADKPAGK